jgi:sugar phosphate isomerase/epimerase
MEICLYTDSVRNLSRSAALDIAADVGASAVELAVGGQSGAPHVDLAELEQSAAARAFLASELAERGLRLAAFNCSAWPMHPIKGDEQVGIIRAAIRLAAEFDVTKIVTMAGCPGDSTTANTINWIFYPWPPEGVELLERQWDQALTLWEDLAAYAAKFGVTRIALELHPLHLAYNTPSLLKIRDLVGPIIGATVDPSHMFWQRMDPVAVVEELGPAVHHVHLKDVEFNTEQLGLAGVLDSRPFELPRERAWNFRTVGKGHGNEFWRLFLNALAEVGYDDVLSIENEDPYDSPEQGVIDAARFTHGVLAALADTQRS